MFYHFTTRTSPAQAALSASSRLASFTPSDAFAYWSAVGLNVNSNRIKIVNIDGGSGAPSDKSGSDETTLDVEQSGGIAPGAKMIVYEAPNTNQGYIDAFRQSDSIECRRQHLHQLGILGVLSGRRVLARQRPV